MYAYVKKEMSEIGGDEQAWIVVEKKWYDMAVEFMKNCEKMCPFCGSTNIIKQDETKEFYARFGCGSCDQWFTGYCLK